MKKNYSSPKNYFVGPSSFGMEPFNLDVLKKLINEMNDSIFLEEREGDFISSFAIPFISDNRDRIVNRLQENNIEVRPLIAGNMANKPMWKGSKDNLFNCDLVDQKGFYLPNHQDLEKEDILKITKIVNEEF